MADRSLIQFEDGDILYAAQVNEIAYPRLTGEPLLGHGEKVLNENLSDASDQIKTQFYSWFNRFRVSVSSGLTVSITSGIIQSGGLRVSIPPQSFSVPNNATNFIWIGKGVGDSTILVRISPDLPANAIALAKVTTVSGVITQLEDIRNPVAEYLPPEIPQAVLAGSCILTFDPPSVTQRVGYQEILTNPRAISRSENPNLFALFGTYYGIGDGVTTFGIPGHGGNLIKFLTGSENIGSFYGSNTLTISTDNLPNHSHTISDSGGHSHVITTTPHTHGTTQTPHSHPAYQDVHNHYIYAQQYDEFGNNQGSPRDYTDGFYSKGGVGCAGEDVGSPNYILNNLSGTPVINPAQPNVYIIGQGANITVSNASVTATASTATTGITTTTSTGNSNPVSIAPRSVAMRLFIKT
jgi:microcystin-dependent protein